MLHKSGILDYFTYAYIPSIQNNILYRVGIQMFIEQMNESYFIVC